MFDLLVSADSLVPDADDHVRRLVEVGALPEQPERWRDTPPGYGYRAWWCRVARDLRTAPTRLEVIAPYGDDAQRDPTIPYPFIGEILASQGQRPVKTHSTVVGTARFDELLERVRTSGAAHRLDAPTEFLPFPRLWMGRTEADPVAYDPDADGGLWIEALPVDAFGLPPAPPPDATSEPTTSGETVRIASRGFVTPDLDATLARVAAVLDWHPAGPPERHDGVRSVHLAFGHPHSATVQLLQPEAPGPEADFLDAWGPGPYDIRLAVGDLDARAADLQARGAPMRWRGAGPDRRIDVDPGALDGTRITFVTTTSR